MNETDEEVQTTESLHPEVTLESLAIRMDNFGAQMDWLCENMAGLFQFVTQVGSSGGGIRGLMSALKNGGPDLTSGTPTSEGKEVVTNG